MLASTTGMCRIWRTVHEDLRVFAIKGDRIVLQVAVRVEERHRLTLGCDAFWLGLEVPVGKRTSFAYASSAGRRKKTRDMAARRPQGANGARK